MVSEKIKLDGIKMFEKMYPYAKSDKFAFEYNLDNNGNLKTIDIYYKVTPKYSDWIPITDSRFQKYKKDLYGISLNYPVLWLSNGTIQPIPKTLHPNVLIFEEYPKEINLNYSFNNFKIYVDTHQYFFLKLPSIVIDTDQDKWKWDDNESYYQACIAMYCASYCCGVSMQHLNTTQQNVHPKITSLMCFHIYFITRRLLIRMRAGEPMRHIVNKFNAHELYNHIFRTPRAWRFNYKTGVSDLQLIDIQNDFKDTYHYIQMVLQVKISNTLGNLLNHLYIVFLAHKQTQDGLL